MTWTTRLRKDAALYELPGPRTGKRGRPRAKGKRLPRLAALADGACFTPVAVRRYGKTTTAQAAVVQCLWYGALGPRPIQAVLIRDHTQTGYDLALATTDLAASPAAVIERYAARWSIEVAIEDAKQIFGHPAGLGRRSGITAKVEFSWRPPSRLVVLAADDRPREAFATRVVPSAGP